MSSDMKGILNAFIIQLMLLAVISGLHPSLRNLEEMMAECGIIVDHSTHGRDYLPDTAVGDDFKPCP